jgi:hypothetical protein
VDGLCHMRRNERSTHLLATRTIFVHTVAGPYCWNLRSGRYLSVSNLKAGTLGASGWLPGKSLSWPAAAAIRRYRSKSVPELMTRLQELVTQYKETIRWV